LEDEMDYGKLVGESFDYAKEGLIGNFVTWILLIVLSILPAIPIFIWVLTTIPLMMGGKPNYAVLIGGFIFAFILAVILGAFFQGYMLKILRGEKPLPPVTDFGILFTDGIKYLIINFVYMIPVILVLLITPGAAMLAVMPAVMSGNYSSIMGLALGSVFIGLLVSIILAIILALFAIIGIVRFARTGTMSEAFNFNAILVTMRKIGSLGYIIALIILFILVFIVMFGIGIIPYIGGLLQLLISPFIGVFIMRYICLLYDSAGA
jgi:hypothetical protein